MPSSELAQLLDDASTSLFIMREGGAAIGLCEFVNCGQPDVELTNFGLIPQAQGRRLGPYLLNCALRATWAASTRGVWLHTDTNDHPGAQTVYQKAGFAVIRRQMEDFAD